MKSAIIPVLALCGAGLCLAACDDPDEPDVVVIDRDAPEGDAASLSIGDNGVSISASDDDGGASTSITAGEGGVSIQTRDND